MKKILILGSSGLLGLNLVEFFLRKNNYKITKFIRKEKKNFNNFSYCIKYLKKNNFDTIVNLSAITNVDECEKNTHKAKRINFEIVKNISKAIDLKKLDTFLIQLSTDQFYNKFKKNNESCTKIINYYAKTKYLAEREAIKINAAILRTNFFVKSKNNKRKSFSDWIFHSLKDNKKINLADDIFFSPISIKSLCKVIDHIIVKKKVGVFNIGSKKGLSKFHFGLKFAKLLKLDTNLIKRVNYKDLKFRAKRPKDMRMQLKKFEKVYLIKFKTLQDEIKLVAKEYG
jgi:dTDP-4-dehydrorhamnose reductase